MKPSCSFSSPPLAVPDPAPPPKSEPMDDSICPINPTPGMSDANCDMRLKNPVIDTLGMTFDCLNPKFVVAKDSSDWKLPMGNAGRENPANC